MIAVCAIKRIVMSAIGANNKMNVYKNTFEKEYDAKAARGVALGNFDGIHKGHAQLISTLVKECKKRNLRSCVYTFENHPNNVLFKDKHTPVIMTEEQKIKIVEEAGADELFLEHFNEEYAETSPDDFVERILDSKLNVKLVVVGFDYTYGKFGKGNIKHLTQKAKEYGFDVIVIPEIKKYLPTSQKEVTVSSTVLRELIQTGNMADYKVMTGRNYSIPGKVEKGRKVGEKIGFPTANILPREGFALPEFGVYATLTHTGGNTYRSITNIGNNPTFENIKTVTVETHIIGFNGELYGQDIEVEFIKKMRGEKKFSSAEELSAQINSDLKERKEMTEGIQKVYDRKGVEIYYVPTDIFKTAVIKVMICDNLNAERAYKNGLIPVVLNSGTENYPSIKKITEKMQEMYGAGISATVSSTAEVQYTEFWAEYTEPVYVEDNQSLEHDIIDFLFEMMFKPATENYDGKTGFVNDTFNRERINRDEQIRAIVNDKHTYSQRRCIEIMCEGEPYAVNSVGNAGDGDALTPVELYDYYRNEYLDKSAIKIFYCGKKYPEELTDYTKKYFKDSDRIVLKEAYLEKTDIKEDEVKRVTEVQDVTQGKLFMGYRLNAQPLKDEYYAALLACAVLGQGTQSKMFMNIREKNSLAYYAAAYSTRAKGLMFAYCGIECENKEAAETMINEQLDDIRKGNITEEEHTAAVKMICNDLYSYNDNQGILLSYYFNQMVVGKITDPAEFAMKIEAVTIEEISAAAKKIQLDTVFFLDAEEEPIEEGGEE